MTANLKAKTLRRGPSNNTNIIGYDMVVVHFVTQRLGAFDYYDRCR